MKIDEIKEWRLRGNVLSQGTLEIIDTLLAEVERLRAAYNDVCTIERVDLISGASGTRSITMEKQEIDDIICEILVNDGPDGHVDGHEIITDFIMALLDDTCYMCAAEQLEQQLQQAHRAAEESAKDAYRRGWEQAKAEARTIARRSTYAADIEIRIDAMEYGGDK